MQRLLVVLLAAFDAAVAAAIGLAVFLAPLTVLWTLAFGTNADWGSLWPLAGTLWQFGHGAPVAIAIPDDVVVAVGISPDAATFTLSVAPLASLVFTLLYAARSGVRAARSGAWLTGAVSGAVAFALLSAGVALTSRVDAVTIPLEWAVAAPASVYLVGALAGAVQHAWREGDEGVMDRLHDAIDRWGEWGVVPGAAVRGAAFAIVGLVGAAALGITILVLLRGGEAVALFETARVDALGAAVLTLGHLAYIPTVVVWGIAWLSGPGFAVGVGTAVTPAGTQLGVVPGIPIFGLLPENDSIWTLVVVLVPVAAGAAAGWAVRSRLVWEGTPLRLLHRGAIAALIAMLSAGAVAVAAALASGSIGPGRLVEVGPSPGWTALAVGAEVLVGAAVLLLAPRHRDELAEERTDRWLREMTEWEEGGDASRPRVD